MNDNSLGLSLMAMPANGIAPWFAFEISRLTEESVKAQAPQLACTRWVSVMVYRW